MKRAILVGAGGMGGAWAGMMKPRKDVEQAAWVDIAPGRAAEQAAKFGLDVWTGTDLKAAIQEVEADFVIDVTIPEAHRETVVTALDAGLPVIGEKPMAASMADAGEMVRAARRNGLLYMVSQSRRWMGSVPRLMPLIPAIGPLQTLNCDFYLGAHFGGFRDEMESPLILDMSIHHFDSARQYLGLNPVAVYCEEYNPGWSWYKGDVSAACIFEMEGGLRFNYRGSWCAEGQATSWNGRWEFYGRDGYIKWDGEGDIDAEQLTGEGDFIVTTRRLEVAPEPEGYQGGIEGSLTEFLNALETGRTPQCSCEDNIWSLAMVFAAVKSSREGRRVKVEEVMPDLS
ncbi:MAG: Gfo/Idh/MocA family oxidoreductase [Fimbriimonadaceae bacterium]|nr:Gfo/Idh/MocA family oxidoreductase [Fimbriimonadaceae bacterium]